MNIRKTTIAALLAVWTSGMTAVTVPENNSLGVIAGRICDTENHSLPGATIIVEGENIGVTSDINGYYTMPSLKPGTYTIKVTYVGYAPVRKTITIGNGKAATANVVLTEGMELDEVKVKGAFSGQRRAMQMQKSSMGVTNVVSADQVGKFPDSNIGDALKRINGINVQYDQGEARFGQVRGTSADLTSVTVNGNRLPSAEGDTRNVQLDLIPADMVQTIGVQGRDIGYGRRCHRWLNQSCDKEHPIPPCAQLHRLNRLHMDLRQTTVEHWRHLGRPFLQ